MGHCFPGEGRGCGEDMGKRLLMGNEAMALGALRAGVSLCAGYPGTPSSEVLETIAREKPKGVYAEWSVNEKTALEVGAGAAICGARVLVTMKQVGLNVASDPLMSLNYIGVKGGMVVLVADDPGPISSQTEQDTRHFGQFAKLAVFDPSDPEEAYLMMADAFDVSERIGRPVLFRPTTRVCHGYATVETLPPLPLRGGGAFEKGGGRWVIFPRLSYASHLDIEASLEDLAHAFSRQSGNQLTGRGKLGIATGGVSYRYVKEALRGIANDCKLLKVATVPFPTQLGLDFLEGLDQVLVAEELDPVIERELLLLCAKNNKTTIIRGKLTGDMPRAGEYADIGLGGILASFLGAPATAPDGQKNGEPRGLDIALPSRPPVLCAGCPHRTSFLAVKAALRGHRAVCTGDIGCYTLGNVPPLNMVDTCLCMGAGLTVAQGIKRADPDIVNVAFIGDSTFFHTGLPGVVNAVYNGHDVIFAILDNATTAMTGGQPHPGTGHSLTGESVRKISIYDVLKGIGVTDVQRVNAFDYEAAKGAMAAALHQRGARAILFEGPCVVDSQKGAPLTVDAARCTGCHLCITSMDCPAMSKSQSALTPRGKRAVEIDPNLCTGCGLCQSFCRFQAIRDCSGSPDA